MSVPAGMSDGLPVGLQLMARHMGEPTLLRAAHAYEQATEWHTLRPSLRIEHQSINENYNTPI